MVDGLAVAADEIDWTRVVAFHMDEYLGLDADHPASFRRYLQEHLFRLVGLGPDRLRLIPGEQIERPLQTCLAYEDLLRANPTDIVCAGIGENGHLAFNDPPEADFNDPLDVKIVQLDSVTRQQQVAEGWFKRLEDVPTSAITLTVPALLRVQKIIASVPGSRKAEIIRRVVEEPISTNCPATILRTHPDATVFLDAESAAQLDSRTLANADV